MNVYLSHVKIYELHIKMEYIKLITWFYSMFTISKLNKLNLFLKIKNKRKKFANYEFLLLLKLI